MKLPQLLISGILLKRYKRFLADIHLSTGEVITAHCPNSGRLSGLSTPGNPVQVWKSSNPRRRLLYTWEMVRVNSIWVGINTNRSTALAVEAIENGIITQLQGYGGIQTEVRLEADNRFRQGDLAACPVREAYSARLDLRLFGNTPDCFVEIKNVTLVEDGIAYFPDGVTVRGSKHVIELERAVAKGYKGVILFVVQREDAVVLRPADHIDSRFAQTLRQACSNGVQAIAYKASVSPGEIVIVREIPVEL
ncbi:DNA/RNA nuclease SfsA [bacterium]|nr:DNA/RNA nuclease SfsA [bacterium]